jgi:hypothetical protein
MIESTTKQTFTLTVKGRAKREQFAFGTDIVAASGIDDPTVSINAPLVFVGYGVVAPEYKWNDYAGLDVKGEIVLAAPPRSSCSASSDRR